MGPLIRRRTFGSGFSAQKLLITSARQLSGSHRISYQAANIVWRRQGYIQEENERDQSQSFGDVMAAKAAGSVLIWIVAIFMVVIFGVAPYGQPFEIAHSGYLIAETRFVLPVNVRVFDSPIKHDHIRAPE